jgi:Scramblase
MYRFEEKQDLIIEQRREFWELLGVETRNRYDVFDSDSEPVFCVYEEEKSRVYSWLVRTVLQQFRPFVLSLNDRELRKILEFRRPFRFFFHEINVFGRTGELLGRVVRRFTFINREFEVFDANGVLLCSIKGPLFRPWTFKIIQDGTEYGFIKKFWKGLVAEALTDADRFGIHFPDGAGNETKAVLMGALFLIDFMYFESNAVINISLWSPGS